MFKFMGCVMLSANKRVAIIGSNANNGSNAGAFYWNLNNGSGNLNRNIGRQLAGTSLLKLSHNSSVHTQIWGPIVLGREIEEHGAYRQ